MFFNFLPKSFLLITLSLYLLCLSYVRMETEEMVERAGAVESFVPENYCSSDRYGPTFLKVTSPQCNSQGVCKAPAGKDLNITVEFGLKVPSITRLVFFGTVKAHSGVLSQMTLLVADDDACAPSDPKVTNLNCSDTANKNFFYTFLYRIPAVAPIGNYGVNVTVTADCDKIFCGRTDVSISWGFHEKTDGNLLSHPLIEASP